MMQFRVWLSDRLGEFRSRYQITVEQVVQDFETDALSLPQAAPWTKRLTQVIIVGLSVGMGWSILARVDVVIPARGDLEPISQSQAIQSRVGGIVTTVLVHEGEQVEQGQLLLQLDKTALLNQLKSLLSQRQQLVQEIAVLRIARQGGSAASWQQQQVNLPPELINRVQTRMLLVAQLNNDPSGLSSEQRQRYDLFQRQLRDRQSISQLSGSSLDSKISELELTQEHFLLVSLTKLITLLCRFSSSVLFLSSKPNAFLTYGNHLL